MTTAISGKERIARRAARELCRGMYVNIGIGLPSLVLRYLPEDVILHQEGGMLGMGPPPRPGAEDADLIDAGKNPVTLLPGGAFFSSADSHAMIRGGHLDLTIMGAFQVSERGDLANWMVAGRKYGSIGGAMDLVSGGHRVLVLMEHVTKEGAPRLVKECSYPLTGRRVVHRVITELAMLDATPEGFLLQEIAPGMTVEEVQRLTEARLRIAPELRPMSG